MYVCIYVCVCVCVCNQILLMNLKAQQDCDLYIAQKILN